MPIHYGDTSERVLRDHLARIEHLQVLGPDQELEAAALMADGREAENQVAALGGHDAIDLEQAAWLLSRVRRGEDARDVLVGSTRRLVVSIARRHPGSADLARALIAAGDDAVCRAADRYDPTGGLPFSHFARWWIERAMREVADADSDSPGSPDPADPRLLTALGRLHQDDCRVVELRLGLHGGHPLSGPQTATLLGVDAEQEAESEERALAKLRHPCTPGDLTHLRRI